MNVIHEISLLYQKPTELPCNKISSSRHAYNMLCDNWDMDMAVRESFVAMYLNMQNQVIGLSTISKGGVAGTVVDVRLIFATALKCLASGIIVAHNHPSGNLSPSAADRNLTKKIKQGGELLDVKLLDHVILTPEGDYFSFTDEGLL